PQKMWYVGKKRGLVPIPVDFLRATCFIRNLWIVEDILNKKPLLSEDETYLTKETQGDLTFRLDAIIDVGARQFNIYINRKLEFWLEITQNHHLLLIFGKDDKEIRHDITVVKRIVDLEYALFEVQG
ncbi:hypothetical protein ACJX0J_013215, partial [Zea mays]